MSVRVYCVRKKEKEVILKEVTFSGCLACQTALILVLLCTQSIEPPEVMSFEQHPCIHPECLKLILVPLRKEIVVQVANRRRSVFSQRVMVLIHACLTRSVHARVIWDAMLSRNFQS